MPHVTKSNYQFIINLLSFQMADIGFDALFADGQDVTGQDLEGGEGGGDEPKAEDAAEATDDDNDSDDEEDSD